MTEMGVKCMLVGTHHGIRVCLMVFVYYYCESSVGCSSLCVRPCHTFKSLLDQPEERMSPLKIAMVQYKQYTLSNLNEVTVT